MPQIARLKTLRSSKRELSHNNIRQTLFRDGLKRQSTNSQRPAISQEEHVDVFRSALVGGVRSLTPQQLRALQINYDTSGGFLTSPEQMVDRFFLAMSDLVFIRDQATKFPLLKAQSLIIPTVESDSSDFDWTSEVKLVSEDTGLSFGRRLLTPHQSSKAVFLSNKLIQGTAGYAEDIIIDRLSYKSAITEEKAFLTGSGDRQPLGVFTPSDQGINTDRDISCASQGNLYESIIDTKYSLKAQYSKNAQWIIHRDVMKVIAKLKDGDGRYIYHEPKEPGMPGMLSGHPVNLSEYAPSTIASGKYVAILGDFSRYVIADSLDLRVKILSELMAADNKTGIIFTRETDGMPGTAEAFSRIVMA